MSTPAPQHPLRIHLIVLGIGGSLVLLGLGAYSLRRILVWITSVHHVCVFAFLAGLALWGYWVASAIIRRRLTWMEQSTSGSGSPPSEGEHG